MDRLFSRTALVLAMMLPIVAFPGPTAHADEELTTEQKQQVKSLIGSAKSAYEEGKYERAAHLLESAFEIDSRPAFHYRIGISYQNAGKPDRALEHLRMYLDKMPDASNREEVEQRIETLEQQVEQSRERVWDEEDSSQRTWAWATTAIGGTGVVATAIFGGLFAGADTSYRDLRARSQNLRREATNIEAVASRRNTYLTLTYVGASVTAIGTGFATYLWLADPSDGDDGASAGLAPMAGADRLGLELSVRF